MIKSILKTTAIFLATVLVLGTIATTSSSVKIGTTQAEPEYEMDSYEISYGKDNSYYKSKDNNVLLNKIKCNNINVNINGLELDGLSLFLTSLVNDGERDEGQYGANSYGSGGSYDGGQLDYDNGFKLYV